MYCMKLLIWDVVVLTFCYIPKSNNIQCTHTHSQTTLCRVAVHRLLPTPLSHTVTAQTQRNALKCQLFKKLR